MKYFPLFYALENKPCLVVGGGNVASRRAQYLLDAGATVDIIAPHISEKLKQQVPQNGGRLFARPFELDDIHDQYALVIAATNQYTINQTILHCARAQNIPVNVVDDPSACDFIFSSVIQKASLTIAISNGGSSPVLSRLLKQQISAYLPNNLNVLSDFVRQHRTTVKKAISDQSVRVRFWEKLFQGEIGQALLANKVEKASHLFLQALENPQHFLLCGAVYFIGSGSQNPELMTLQAFKVMQSANAVFHDNANSAMQALFPVSAQNIRCQTRDELLHQKDDILAAAQQGNQVVVLSQGSPLTIADTPNIENWQSLGGHVEVLAGVFKQ